MGSACPYNSKAVKALIYPTDSKNDDDNEELDLDGEMEVAKADTVGNTSGTIVERIMKLHVHLPPPLSKLLCSIYIMKMDACMTSSLILITFLGC